MRFRRPELLREAMTHASWNNERGGPSGPGHDNERLEYLGDAVLELVVGEYLFRRFPQYDEGQLTQLRAALVNTNSLARLAEKLQLGEALFVGRGAAKTGARQLPSLLANCFEAMIGAIFLDQGYRIATRVFIQNIGDLADWTDENHKGRLQEVAQDRFGATPAYRVVPAGGPGHRREYLAEALVNGEVLGSGKGTTKQAAEQAAARDSLDRLQPARRRRGARSAAAQAAGAARSAAAGAAAEPVRVRRRIAEAAADRTAGETPRTRAAAARGAAPPAAVLPPAPLSAPIPPAPAAQPRRRGLLSVLRTAAEALVGRALPPGEAGGTQDTAPPSAPSLGAMTGVDRARPPVPASRRPAPTPRKQVTPISGAPAASPTSRPEDVAAITGELEAPSGGRGSRRGRRGGRGRRPAAGNAAATGATVGTVDRAPVPSSPQSPSRRRPAPSRPADPSAVAPASSPAAASPRRRSRGSRGATGTAAPAAATAPGTPADAAPRAPRRRRNTAAAAPDAPSPETPPRPRSRRGGRRRTPAGPSAEPTPGPS